MFSKNRSLKTLICCIFSLLMIFAAVSSFPLNAHAESAVLVDLEERQDITIIVGYDTEKPKIVFIDPSDERYDSDDKFDSVIDAEKSTYYNISDARSGEWKVEYEKGANKEITVDVVPWHKCISAQSLSFELDKRDGYDLPYIKGKLLATYGNEDGYNFILKAVILDADGNITNSIEFADGYGYGGKEKEFSAYPDKLPDGEYYLCAEVYAEDNTGTEVHDFIISTDTFTISGNTKKGDDSLLHISCDVTDSTIDVHFNPDGENLDPDEFALIIIQDGSDEKLSAVTFNERSFSDHVVFDPDGGDITVQINGKDYYGSFYSWSKTFSPKMPLDISIDTPEITNELNAVISFDAGEDSFPAQIKVGENSRNVEFTGNNKAQVSLQSMDVNELSISVAANDILYIVHQRIAVDTIPPAIDIYGASDNMVITGSKAKFIGMTDPDATLTCNGDAVELDEDGNFSFDKSVDDDGSDFRFESSDEAGNTSVRLIHISKGTAAGTSSTSKKSSNGFLKGAAAVGIAVLYALIAGALSIIICKKREKKNQKPRALQAVLFSFALMLAASFTGLGAWQLYSHFQTNKQLSGNSLIELLKSSSISDIADKIDTGKAYLYSSLISFGAAAAIIVLMIVTAVVRKKITTSSAAPQAAAKKDKKKKNN